MYTVNTRLLQFALFGLTLGVLGCPQTGMNQEEVEVAPYAALVAPQDTFVWPEGKRAALSLTFDDARASQIDVGMPILNEHGVQATFYISLSAAQTRSQAWKEAIAQGHEIGNHSLRHPCTGNFPWARDKALEDYSLDQMKQELKAANAAIHALLGMQAVTFAYPCGQTFVGRGRSLSSYVPLVAELFLAGRGWLGEAPNDPAFCDRAQLLGMELDGLSFTEAKTLIESARDNGSWLVLAGHEIGEGGRQTTRADTLRAICAYASDPSNGLWIDTVETIARYVQQTRGQVTP
jgi:peptidoglycan-N-acetylglucosamine deacetylase